MYLYTADSLVASQTGQFPIFVGLLSWGNSTLDTFLYDGNGNTVFYGNETWNGTGWGSQGDENFIWSYNNYNQWVAENYAVLDTPTGWYPTSNYYWWYQLYAVPTGIKDVAKNFASDVYPNPFTHTFTVAYDAESGGTATLLLYDITGRLVTRTVAPASPGSNTLIWDAGYTLPAGMYTYELSLGNAVSRGKVLSNE